VRVVLIFGMTSEGEPWPRADPEPKSHAGSSFATRHPPFYHKTLPFPEPAPLQYPSDSWNTASSIRAFIAPQPFTMGLIVLVLRSYLVFQNVFITFKTLKLPPPSSRNNGQPSVRALTQRKRDMKGCMAIWIVWVSRVPFRALDCHEGVCSSVPWRSMNQSWRK
jgi:hypothetical protein